jgi:two-component system chemotaxis response regulator CheB
MRKSLSLMLESDPEIEVVAAAKNGLEGYNAVLKERPDIVTLDIEMPVMDGLTALQKIMKDCPVPVLMVSSLTTEGADSTLKALEYGALDFIPKGMSHINVGIIDVKEDLIKKVKAIVKQQLFKTKLSVKKRSSPSVIAPLNLIKLKSISPGSIKAIGLGISTGGPLSLQKILPMLNGDLNIPMFIVQHMPPKFTKSLADRLDGLAKINVKEAEDKEVVRDGTAYIAPGGFHMILKKVNGNVQVKISENPSDTIHKPSVDVMLNSLADVYGKNILGVIMTGMGKDGFEGIKKIKNLGGYCIAQNEESCVVYGMPKAVVDGGVADEVVSLEQIPEAINKVTQYGKRI